MKKIKDIVKKLNLDESFLIDFEMEAETLYLAKKEMFVKEGRSCKYIGIVKEGALYAFTSKEENQVVHDLYLPDSLITYYRSFLTQLPANGSIQAAEDSVIYAFSFEKYQSLIKSIAWLKFFKYVADSLFIRKCARENSFMKLSAPERYKQLRTLHPRIEQIFPQYKIASYLGIKAETLSRIKSLDLHQEK
ncbi:hypothetical protein ACM40_18190 [Chryseobacterium sp. BLS98]|uniref:Crp/Fnr family transcriptional regulator n=1 Tax=Chryseobacterium sp. BLS98 TaxID=885586 RepID=UPI00065AE12A|nr:cyclic nucleotide-binding domain-containing protein [Chryseobacterium sp. BLS98]KMQ58896.1 hypothetical protein ACM40_18190 [Chryseobacterium sp. BLS98]